MTPKDNDKFFLFTVISQEYASLGLAWASKVKEVTGIKPHFICSDEESSSLMKENGFSCTTYPFAESDLLAKQKNYGEIHFPNKKAVFTVSLKLAVAAEYLKAGYTVLYSDVDAIWLKDPLTALAPIDADFLFQPGSFPDKVKALWGFSVCTGFFLMRPSPQTIEFADAVHAKFDGDDQRTLNDVLRENYDLHWSLRPEGWEHCSLEDGWTKPVLGHCRRTGLTAAALAHSFYQRHGTQEDTCDHAIVCHPNSPKDEEDKFKILKELGIDLVADPDALKEGSSTDAVSAIDASEGALETAGLLSWIKSFLGLKKS